MGDRLNKDMLEEMFNVQVEKGDRFNSNMIAIGSGLASALWSNYPVVKAKQIMKYPFLSRDFHVWGTGFIKHAEKDKSFYFKNVIFHCLRGQLTKERVEKIIGKKLDIPLGDGGLLAERWVKEPPKKYSVGIIPHFKEQDHPLIQSLKEHYNNSTVIDLTENPKDVVRKIAECEFILSSSLHGLIVADSFHIPNMHVLFYKMGERIRGDGYKFEDYYSSYGLKDNPRMISTDSFPDLDEILNKYLIRKDDVEIKKEQLINAFPL